MRLEPVQSLADVIEIRLDAMDVPAVEACCRLLPHPLLFTNRPQWEGGLWHGSEEDRLEYLLEAMAMQAAYVDLELRAEPVFRRRLLAARDRSSTRIILSWHDFQQTPSIGELQDVLHEMMGSGADIGKIVAMARHSGDVVRLQQILVEANEHDFPLICFSMGEAGRISRLATLFLGGFMTYTSADDRQMTAPGQLSAEKMAALCRLLGGEDDD